ncbi:hypothetical protein BKH44_06380 [Helicobacter sp. 13S00477-4]|nr:hypothetical protein BKH44_06380 [Helicobacter sp. 13S00477-4]
MIINVKESMTSFQKAQAITLGNQSSLLARVVFWANQKKTPRKHNSNSYRLQRVILYSPTILRDLDFLVG